MSSRESGESIAVPGQRPTATRHRVGFGPVAGPDRLSRPRASLAALGRSAGRPHSVAHFAVAGPAAEARPRLPAPNLPVSVVAPSSNTIETLPPDDRARFPGVRQATLDSATGFRWARPSLGPHRGAAPRMRRVPQWWVGAGDENDTSRGNGYDPTPWAPAYCLPPGICSSSPRWLPGFVPCHVAARWQGARWDADAHRGAIDPTFGAESVQNLGTAGLGQGRHYPIHTGRMIKSRIAVTANDHCSKRQGAWSPGSDGLLIPAVPTRTRGNVDLPRGKIGNIEPAANSRPPCCPTRKVTRGRRQIDAGNDHAFI
jgi:hypothetical protein